MSNCFGSESKSSPDQCRIAEQQCSSAQDKQVEVILHRHRWGSGQFMQLNKHDNMNSEHTIKNTFMTCNVDVIGGRPWVWVGFSTLQCRALEVAQGHLSRHPFSAQLCHPRHHKSRENQGQPRHFGTGCEGVDHFLRPAKHLPAEPSFEEEGGRLVGVFHLLFSIWSLFKGTSIECWVLSSLCWLTATPILKCKCLCSGRTRPTP